MIKEKEESISLSVKVPTLLDKVSSLQNRENAPIIIDFYNYMCEKGSSENHKINNLKVVIDYAKYLGDVLFYDVNKKSQFTSFLNSKVKDTSIDPEKRWITTWNHFLNRMKLFFRWLHNMHKLSVDGNDNNDDAYLNERSFEDWTTQNLSK
ncbi:MAG: hypothetical protein M3M88_00815 [Thermoproteota archaeon]|nr:hypothetical protein [Thermoproteota archaeon]